MACFSSGPFFHTVIQYGEAEMTIFINTGKSRQIRFHMYCRKDVRVNLTYFTNVVKIVIFASPYCTMSGLITDL